MLAIPILGIIRPEISKTVTPGGWGLGIRTAGRPASSRDAAASGDRATVRAGHRAGAGADAGCRVAAYAAGSGEAAAIGAGALNAAAACAAAASSACRNAGGAARGADRAVAREGVGFDDREESENAGKKAGGDRLAHDLNPWDCFGGLSGRPVRLAGIARLGSHLCCGLNR